MIISSIETRTVDRQFFKCVRRQLWVRVSTDEGLAGIGEAWTGVTPEPVEAAIHHVLKPLVLGCDAGRIERLWQHMHRHAYRYGTEGVMLCAISGIDLALWDLLGKRLGVPAATLLGGPVKPGSRLYASFPSLEDEGLLTENLDRIKAAGFTGVKLHDLDERLIARARDHVGDDFAIMVDPSGAWSTAEAESKIRRLEQYDLDWVEEPIFPMQDHAALRRLRRSTRIRLAAGENEFTLAGFQRLMQSGAVDFIQPEISKMGGLTAARKLAALAELFNYPVFPHCYAPGPAFFAGLQLGVTQANWDWHEWKWLPAGLEAGGAPGVEISGGCLELPELPGLGFDAGAVFGQ